MRIGIGLALAGAIALAGCHSRDKNTDEAPVDGNAAVETPLAAPPAVTEPTPPPPAVTTNTTARVPYPEPTVDQRVQMQDDADATGMTARSNRDQAEDVFDNTTSDRK